MIKFEAPPPKRKVDVCREALDFIKTQGIDTFVRIEFSEGVINLIEVGGRLTEQQKAGISKRFGLMEKMESE